MAKINYSAAELDQTLDTAVFGSDAVIGDKFARSWRVSRTYLNRRDIAAPGWYRIAQYSGGYMIGTLRIGGVWNSRRPTFAIVDFSNAVATTGAVAKMTLRMCTAAGQSVSKVRFASNGSSIDSYPVFIDIYIPYAMTSASGQGYLYAFDCLGPTEFNVIPPTLVETEPTTSVEFTLSDT